MSHKDDTVTNLQESIGNATMFDDMETRQAVCYTETPSLQITYKGLPSKVKFKQPHIEQPVLCLGSGRKGKVL